MRGLVIRRELVRRLEEEACCERCGWPMYVGDRGYVAALDPDCEPGEGGELFCSVGCVRAWAKGEPV